jgi:hypothetical protein
MGFGSALTYGVGVHAELGATIEKAAMRGDNDGQNVLLTVWGNPSRKPQGPDHCLKRRPAPGNDCHDQGKGISVKKRSRRYEFLSRTTTTAS